MNAKKMIIDKQIKEYLDNIKTVILNGDTFNVKFIKHIKKNSHLNWNEIIKKHNNTIEPLKFESEKTEEEFAIASFIQNLKAFRKQKKQKFDINNLKISNEEIFECFFLSKRFNYFNWMLSSILLESVKQNEEFIKFKETFKEHFYLLDTKTNKHKYIYPDWYSFFVWIYDAKIWKGAIKHKFYTIAPRVECFTIWKSLEIIGTINRQGWKEDLISHIHDVIIRRTLKYWKNKSNYEMDVNTSFRSLIFKFVFIMIVSFRRITYNRLRIKHETEKLQYKHLWRLKEIKVKNHKLPRRTTLRFQ